MRRVIGRKIYDTATADKIASYSNGLGYGNLNFFNESLYRSAEGSWFLAGEGGANTGYRSYHGNKIFGGEGLSALTPKEAREWLESYGETNALELCFGAELEEA